MDQRTMKRLGILGGGLGLLIVLPLLYVFLFGGGGGRQQITQLMMWGIFDDPELYTGIIQEYQAKDPSVRISYTKKKDIQELETDLINELAEGKGPDIVAISPSWLKKHGAKFVPVPNGFEYANPSAIKEIFAPFVAEDVIVTNESGKQQVMAIPVSVETLAVIYNKSYFLQNLASASPAETWTMFVEDVLKSVRRNTKETVIRKTPIALGRVDNIRRGLDIVSLLFLQNGVSLYDPTVRTVTLDNPVLASGQKTYPAINALDFYANFGKPGDENFVWSLDQTKEYEKDDEVGAFARGEIGMIFGYPYMLGDIERLIDQYATDGAPTIVMEDIGVAEVPQIATEGNQKVTLSLYYPFAVPKVSKKQDKAWAFIEFLASEEVQRYLFKQKKKIASRRSLISEQSKDPDVGAFASSVGFARTVFIPDEAMIKKTLDSILQKMQSGKIDSTDGITELSQTWQCALKKVIPTATEPLDPC